MMMKLIFTFLALIAFARSMPMPGQEVPVRLCATSEKEFKKCEAMKTSFDERGLLPQLICVLGENKYDCMQLIKDGQADIISLWSMDVWIAGKFDQLVPLLVEKHTTTDGWPYAYKALAIILKSDASIQSVGDLRGKKSCHTGINRHVGWLYPMSVLIEKGLITHGDCINNVPNMAGFFNQSCASGANNDAFDPDKIHREKLCALCGGVGDKFCSKDDPYASYTGALKCLVDGRGDVAFVKDTTFAEVVKERPELANQKDQYELLCLDGGRKSLDDFETCNWGTIPERAVMAAPEVSLERREAIKSLFQTAQNDQSTFNLFESDKYEGGKNLIFGDRTLSLVDVGDKNTYEKVLGDYVRVRNHQFLCPVPAARWCVISAVEDRKCKIMRRAFAAKWIKPDLECVLGQDTADCMRLIKENKADLISLDSGDIYKGGREDNLKPFLVEDSGNDDAKYWAVAVVKKSNADINFNNLQGKKSCHTAIGRTAGWNVPVATLLKAGKIFQTPDCNIAEAVGNYFGGSCAPGALLPAYNKNGSNPESLCSLCAGEGDAKCSRTESEPFYGYTGAFRCMATGVGDVAFVKHLTPLENTDGKNLEEWAKDLVGDDFELLCPDGSRKGIREYASCNLARVPAHAVVTSNERGSERVGNYTFMLDIGQSAYGDRSAANFRMFVSPGPSKDLIFTSSTVSLKKLPEDQRDYRSYLGNFVHVFEIEDTCSSSTTGGPTASS